MPQPYRGKGNLRFANGIPPNRSALAGEIAPIANLWTYSEDIWGVLLAAMIGSSDEAGLAIFQSLTGSGAQRSVLIEIADRYLGPELRPEFDLLMKDLKGRAIERNRVVHGLWFVDDDNPNVLVLAPQSLITNAMAKRLLTGFAAKKGIAPKFEQLKPSAFEGSFTYNRKDFRDIRSRIEEFIYAQDRFFDKLIAAQGLPPFGPPAPPAKGAAGSAKRLS